MSTTIVDAKLLQSVLPSEPSVFTPTLMNTISDMTTHVSSTAPDTNVAVAQVTVITGEPLTVPAGTELAIVTVDGTSTTDVGVALSDVDVVVLKGTGGVDITFSNIMPPDSSMISERTVVALTANNNITVADTVHSVIVVNTGDNTVTGGEGADKIVTGSGNTTVHGGDGADVIFSGSGTANLDAGNGDDMIITGSGNATVDAGAGADTIVTSTGNTTIAGGGGSDMIVLAGSGTGTTTVDGGSEFDQLNIARSADQISSEITNGVLTVTDLITGAITHAKNVEYISLLNGDAIVMCADSDQATIAQMYESFFGHAADGSGLQYWFEHHAAGESMDSIAADFAKAGNFDSGNTDNADFVEQLYVNTFGHASDADGKAYWVKELDDGATYGDVGLSFSMIAVENYGVTTVTTIGNINIVDGSI